MVDFAVEKLGTLNGIFNNAGIGLVKPFLEMEQIRRRVAPRAVSGGAQPALEHRRDGALSIGAGDDEARIRAFWMTERLEERAYLFKAELDADGFKGEQRRAGGDCHACQVSAVLALGLAAGAADAAGRGADGGRPIMPRNTRASVALSSRRSTIRSMNPFSIRNSLR